MFAWQIFNEKLDMLAEACVQATGKVLVSAIESFGAKLKGLLLEA